MKKITIFVVITILSFCGCSSKENKPNYNVEPTLQQKNSKEALKDL